MDYGLIGGIAKGLDSGLKAYQDAVARREKREADAEARKFQQEQFNAELQMKGYQKDPESGKYLRSAEYQQEQEKEYQQKLGLIDRKGLVEAKLIGAKAKAGGDSGLLGPGGKAPTAEQSKAAGFAARIKDSSAIIDSLDAKGEGSASYSTAIQKGLNQIPGIGTIGRGIGLIGNSAQSSDQAERDFINATLRRESGASISPAEFSNARQQYIPQPGDSKEVREQKRKNRLNVLASLEVEAGPRLVQAVASRSNELIGNSARDPKQSGGGFPRTVKNPKTGKRAQVANMQELQEAMAEGFN